MKIFKVLLPKLLAILLIIVAQVAYSQIITSIKCAPDFSGTTAPYRSDLDIIVKADQAGNAYFVLYKSATPVPTVDQIISYAKGTTPLPPEVVSKGVITVAAPNTEYTYHISNLPPHQDYFAYAVLENSSNQRSPRKSTDVRLMEAKKSPQYYYMEYLSDKYLSSTGKFPLMVFLHGVGETGNVLDSLKTNLNAGPPKHITLRDNIPELSDFIIISPTATGWNSTKLDQFFKALIDSNSRIDPNRIYLTGLSLGGEGTWSYAIAHPERLAAIVPISGAKWGSEPYDICVLKDMPIWAFHDDPDSNPNTSTKGSINLIKRVRACNPTGHRASLTLMRTFDRKSECAIDPQHSIWHTAYGPNHKTPYGDVQCVAGTDGTTGRDVTEDLQDIPAGSTVYKWLLRQTRGITANAGEDITLTLPVNSTTITGLGQSTSAIASYAWSQVSGTPTTLTNANTATVGISGLVAGVFVFQLAVTDENGNTGTDQVRITVYEDNGVTKTIKIDFRGSVPAAGDTQWNDFNASGAAGSTLTNLKYSDGASTPYTITVASRFTATTANGSTATNGIYPVPVMQTSWYTNSTTIASVTLSGLNNDKKYTLKFFGSRNDSGGTINRNTEYTVESTIVTLNASNNATTTADISQISPINGGITFTVKAAAGGSGLGYLNAMEIVESAVEEEGQNVRVDFRGSSPAPGDPAWNDFNSSGTTGATLPNLTNMNGDATNYTITVSDGFSGINANGVTSTTGVYPATVMETAWYTSSTNTGSISISGLDNAKRYTLKLFGSRNDSGGTINRNTDYSIGGVTKTLNASNNSTTTADFENISPGSGVITFTVKGATGASSGLGYLNALEIIEHAGTSSATSMAQNGEIQVLEVNVMVKDAVDIYPSPYTNKLTVSFHEKMNGKVSISLKDMNGRVYFYKRGVEITAGDKIELDLSNKGIPKGLGVIEVQSSNGYLKTFKVLKE